MERSYQNLPPEILRIIFSYLGSKDLNRAQLTCKQWSPVAQRLLYSYMRFQSQHAENILHMLRHHPSLAQAVNRVSFDLFKLRDYNTMGDTNDEEGILDIQRRRYKASQHYQVMLEFLRLCPNITLIKLPADPPKSIYQDLIELHQGGYLRRLGEIDDYCCLGRDYEANIPGYYNALSAFKSSVQNMYLTNRLDSITQGNLVDSASSLVFDNIASFPQLQQLHLEMHNYTHLHEFDSFLDKCTEKLTTLRMSIMQHPESHTCIINQQHIKQLPNIRKLDISTSATSSNQELRYITRKFPNLQDLSFQSKLMAVPIVDASRFFSYICRIPSLRIRGGVILTADDFAEYMPQLLQRIKFGSLSLYCERISQHVGGIQNVQIYDLYTATYGNSSVSTPGVFIKTAFAKVPLETMMTCQQKHVQRINIAVVDRGLENAVDGEDLGKILNYFSNLTHLCVSGLKIAHLEDIAVETKRLNLQSFKLSHCSMNVDIFSRMSQRIESIEYFALHNSDWIENDSNGFTFDFQMPFTKVGQLYFYNNESWCPKPLVRVVTNSITRYYTYADGRQNKLTYSEYKRLINESEQPRVNLCFASVSSFGGFS